VFFEFQTGADGRYVADVPPDTYNLVFGECEQGGVWAPKTFSNKKGIDFAQATAITVASGQTITGKNANLTRGGRITGTVKDGSGNPLEGICLRPLLGGTAVSEVASAFGVCTGPTGEYALTAVTAGKNKVQAIDFGDVFQDEYYNNKTTFATANNVTIVADTTKSGVDFVLAPV
jgi:hypothetical protein